MGYSIIHDLAGMPGLIAVTRRSSPAGMTSDHATFAGRDRRGCFSRVTAFIAFRTKRS